MRCSKAQSYLSQELDEQLPADVTGDLDRHLDACAACRAYREDLALGQRLLAVSEPELPDNFEWKLQLRLNRALRESAGEHLFPWQQEEKATRWRFLQGFGAATAVGLAAVLALAMVIGPQAISLPGLDVSGAAGPVARESTWDGNDRTELYLGNIFAGRGVPVSTGNGGFGQRQSSPLLDRNWAGGFLEEDRTILHLQSENRRLRTMVFQQRRDLQSLQTRLDTVPGAALDLQESR